ncbi:MAG: phage scaffolding protein [Acutalibacteraceae bacterium]
MKNIITFLSKFGFELSDDKKTDFETAFNENYTAVTEVEKLTTDRDNYKTQLETSQNALKEFEGIDVKELQGKIHDLTTNLKNQQTEYENKISDMEFNSVLSSAISKSGAKNSKAVMALLDVNALKASKNQADDITKALEQVKSENDYMFTSDEPIKNAVHNTGNSSITGGNLDMMRSVMGLPSGNKN